jgi:hypothetical protein
MKSLLFRLIKRISMVLITSAIGLELWLLYAALTHSPIPSLPYPILWFAQFALTAHFLEGIVAAIYAPSHQKAPLSYGIYTFFVGTVGLLELWTPDPTAIKPNQG